MAAIAPTLIPAAPPVPDSGQPEATFDTMYENFNRYEKDTLVPGFNAGLQNTYENALAAEGAKDGADEAAQSATEQAGFADQSRIAAEAAASAAGEQAGIAGSAAGTATTAAGTATTQAGLADTARQQAQTARTGAETARTGAETARSGAEAARDQAQIFATQQLVGHSTTSLTPGAGAKTFTIETGRAFVPGMYLVATSTGTPSVRMAGYVSSYDTATGQLVINVDAFGGSGARADWVIGVAVAGQVGGITTQRMSASGTATAGVYYVIVTPGITLTVPSGFTKDQTLGGKNISGGVCYINWGTNTVSGDTPESPMRWPVDATFETIYDGSTFA